MSCVPSWRGRWEPWRTMTWCDVARGNRLQQGGMMSVEARRPVRRQQIPAVLCLDQSCGGEVGGEEVGF